MIIILILYAVVYVECGGWDGTALAIQRPIYFCVAICSTVQNNVNIHEMIRGVQKF